jgi:small GTP-binding protein
MKPLAALKKLLAGLAQPREAHRIDDEWSIGAGGLGLGSILNALDWEHVREEVDRESRARIVLIGPAGAGKSTLLNHFKGFAVSPASPPRDNMGGAASEDFGLFAVVDVPGPEPGDGTAGFDATWLVLHNASLILWVMDGTAGMRTWEYEWISRVIATGKPVTLVLNKIDLAADAHAAEQLRRKVPCPVIPIAARDGTNVDAQLLPHIVDVSPQLNTALGREVPAWRRMAARRVTRRAIALSGMIGAEPVPLLDVPFQVLIQLQLVMRLAAIHGEPLGDRYSRELLATMVSGAGLRFLGQQLAKLIPLLGWAMSGVLAAGGTWAIGRVAAEYFERGRRVRRRLTDDDRPQAVSGRQSAMMAQVRSAIGGLRSVVGRQRPRHWLRRRQARGESRQGRG